MKRALLVFWPLLFLLDILRRGARVLLSWRSARAIKRAGGQLTAGFHLRDFRCADGEEVPRAEYAAVSTLAQSLQALQDYLKKPVRVVSGYRTAAYNHSIGSSAKSYHTDGKAADIVVEGLTPKRVALTIEKLVRQGKMAPGGIGFYPTFTHYDLGKPGPIWKGRRKRN